MKKRNTLLPFFAFFLLLVPFLSFADLEPVFPDDASKQAFVQTVIQANPWVAPIGIGANLPGGIDQAQKFLPGLLNHPTYAGFQKYARPMMTIHVEQAKQVPARVSVLPPEALERIRGEVGRVFEQLDRQNGESLVDALDRRTAENLRTMSQSDPRGILTGMVQSLPREVRGPLFKIGSLDELFNALSARPDLTDQTLRENFQGAPHQIQPEQVSRAFLLERVGALLALERETISLFRAKWFLKDAPASEIAQLTQDTAALVDKIGRSPSSAFDLLEAETQRFHEFFEALMERANLPSNDARRRAKHYLERVAKVWAEAEHVFQEEMVTQGQPFFSIREVPPYLAVHRSNLSGDCGTHDDFPFPYSPIERTFFVFNPNGGAIGYIGTTLIETEGVLTLYVHDATGPMPQQIRDTALDIIYRSLKHFGTDKMTLAVTGYVQRTGAQGPRVVNQYLDTEIRQYFIGFSVNPHGDRPQDNIYSTVFVPQDALLDGLLFHVEEIGKPVVQEKPPATRQEAFVQLLELTLDRETAEEFLGFLGIEKGEIERILGIVQNKDRLPLAEYYQRMEGLFNEYEAKLSENFLKKHEELFMRGHLNAADAVTSADEGLKAKTVSFVISVIRRGRHRERAYDLIKLNPTFFSSSEKFRAYVGAIPLGTPEHLFRLRMLVHAGIAPEVIAPTVERLEELSRAGDTYLQVWSIGEWRRRTGRELLPEMLTTLAQALKNEKHETDESSLMAVHLLERSRTQDVTVLDSLRKSVAREDNPTIAYLASKALLRSGVSEADVEALVQKNKHNVELQRKMQALAEQWRRRHPCQAALQVVGAAQG